jgi:hypothetical protein
MYLFISIGGVVGSYIPIIFFHSSSFGEMSILGGTVGSLLGIFLAAKLS